jgi:SAM-dependent methyltransferase
MNFNYDVVGQLMCDQIMKREIYVVQETQNNYNTDYLDILNYFFYTKIIGYSHKSYSFGEYEKIKRIHEIFILSDTNKPSGNMIKNVDICINLTNNIVGYKKIYWKITKIHVNKNDDIKKYILEDKNIDSLLFKNLLFNNIPNINVAQLDLNIKNKFNLIIAQNVFAHTHDIKSFLDKCYDILGEDGILYIQTSQSNMILNNEFDTTYHEHLSFFNSLSMKTIVEKCNLRLNNVFKFCIIYNFK